jgi:hypothetical protein
MKEIFGVFALVVLGGIVGNVLYAHTLGDPTDYHWVRGFVFSILFAAVLVLVRKYRLGKSRDGVPAVRSEH